MGSKKEMEWCRWAERHIKRMEDALRQYSDSYLLGPAVAQDALREGVTEHDEMVRGFFDEMVPNVD